MSQGPSQGPLHPRARRAFCGHWRPRLRGLTSGSLLAQVTARRWTARSLPSRCPGFGRSCPPGMDVRLPEGRINPPRGPCATTWVHLLLGADAGNEPLRWIDSSNDAYDTRRIDPRCPRSTEGANAAVGPVPGLSSSFRARPGLHGHRARARGHEQANETLVDNASCGSLGFCAHWGRFWGRFRGQVSTLTIGKHEDFEACRSFCGGSRSLS